MALSQSSEGDSERFTPPRVGIPRDLQSCGEFLPGQSGIDQAPAFEPAVVAPCVFELQGLKNMCGIVVVDCSHVDCASLYWTAGHLQKEGMAGIGVIMTHFLRIKKNMYESVWAFMSIKNKLKPHFRKRKEGRQGRKEERKARQTVATTSDFWGPEDFPSQGGFFSGSNW